jgi:hypothetical protein
MDYPTMSKEVCSRVKKHSNNGATRTLEILAVAVLFLAFAGLYGLAFSKGVL